MSFIEQVRAKYNVNYTDEENNLALIVAEWVQGRYKGERMRRNVSHKMIQTHGLPKIRKEGIIKSTIADVTQPSHRLVPLPTKFQNIHNLNNYRNLGLHYAQIPLGILAAGCRWRADLLLN